jgi:hypothetical protein
MIKLWFIEIGGIQLGLPSISYDLCIYRQQVIALVHENRKYFQNK